MKRNWDYIHFILSEIEDDYAEAVMFKNAFQRWMELEPRSDEERKDFIFASDLLIREGYIEARSVTSGGIAGAEVLVITWKGFDLLDQLRAGWGVAR